MLNQSGIGFFSVGFLKAFIMLMCTMILLQFAIVFNISPIHMAISVTEEVLGLEFPRKHNLSIIYTIPSITTPQLNSKGLSLGTEI